MLHKVLVVFKAHLHLAAEVDFLSVLRAGGEPRAAQVLPVVGQLHLLAVYDLLLEDTKLIADGVAGGGDLQGGHGFQIAGGQAAQAAVAQTGIRLQLEDVGGVEAQGIESLLQLGQNTQVVGVLFQGTAHQKLQGQIMYLTGAGLVGLFPGLHPVVGHDIPQNQGAGLEHVSGGGFAHVAAEGAAQFVYHQSGKLFGGISHVIDPTFLLL